MSGDGAGGFLGRVRSLFARPPQKLFVEEDQWGEVEVLPAVNTDWCRAELDKIAAFSEEHRAPDGAGWTDIYVRPPAPVPLADLRLPLETVLGRLGARLQRFDTVMSGSFYAPEEIAGARAFGPSPKTALIVIGDTRDAIVKTILLVADEDDGAAGLMTVLESLQSPGGLIIVDWLRGELIRIQSPGGG